MGKIEQVEPLPASLLYGKSSGLFTFALRLFHRFIVGRVEARFLVSADSDLLTAFVLLPESAQSYDIPVYFHEDGPSGIPIDFNRYEIKMCLSARGGISHIHQGKSYKSKKETKKSVDSIHFRCTVKPER